MQALKAGNLYVNVHSDAAQGRRNPRAAAAVAWVFLAVLLFATAGAAAQFPDRPMRLVVPQAAGSATDNIARLLAPELAKQLGQPVVVDNRPGGALTIGIDAVAKSRAGRLHHRHGAGRRARDHAPHGGEAALRHRARPAAGGARQPPATCCSRSRRRRRSSSVQELIDYAKKNPGKLSNASSSNGSPGHVSGELFKYMTGTEIVHVPYKGGAAAIADLIAGNVQLMFESTNSIAPHVKAGRVRALAVTGAQALAQPARRCRR